MTTKTSENIENHSKNLDGRLETENIRLRELLGDTLIELENLKKRLKEHEQPNDGYNKCWTMVAKIVFLVTKAHKPLRSAEIIELLLQREPAVVNKQVSIQKYISAFLNTAMKYLRLVPYKLKGVRGNFYCLPEWIDEHGQLSSEMRRKIV